MRLIDADAFKEYIDKYMSVFQRYDPRGIKMCINAQPTIDAEPVKHGRWIEQKVNTDNKAIEEWQSAKCSKCGKYHTTPYLYYFDDFNYCSNCGAKMDEVNDDSK